MPNSLQEILIDLNRALDDQLARIRLKLSAGTTHSLGPRKPDLTEQEAQLLDPHHESDSDD